MALCAAHVVSHTTGGEFDEHSLFIPMALHTAQPPASEVEWQKCCRHPFQNTCLRGLEQGVIVMSASAVLSYFESSG
eukprot:scaffold52332_cov19-Tisochrysis_lutea.AAC.1